MSKVKIKLLDKISSPSDLKLLSLVELNYLADELRSDLISSVSKTGGHLGAGLGVVELTNEICIKCVVTCGHLGCALWCMCCIMHHVPP